MQIVTAPAAGAAASYDVLAVLRESLMNAATGALPYIGVGVAAAVIVLAGVWGITAAIRAMRSFVDGGWSDVETPDNLALAAGEYDVPDDWDGPDDYDRHDADTAWDLENDPGYFEPQGEWMPDEGVTAANEKFVADQYEKYGD